jgi:hypothetical protein
MMSERFILNDPYFFMMLGKVRVVHSSRIAILSDKEIVINGKKEPIDHYFNSRKSSPKPVEITEADNSTWRFDYSENLHGVWNAERPNVYFLGGERPTTGGFIVTSEAQAMLIHQLISSCNFREKMIREYASNFASWRFNFVDAPTTDKGVKYTSYSGVTNFEIGKLIGSHWTAAKSIMDGRFRECIAGPCLPMRNQVYGPYADKKIEDKYLHLCKRFTNESAWGILCSDKWALVAMINLLLFVLVQKCSLMIILLVALAMNPMVCKYIKAASFPYMSYAGSTLFPTLMTSSMLCVALNMLLWLATSSSVSALAPFRAFLGSTLMTIMRSGLVQIPLLTMYMIRNQYLHGKLLFNDVRGKDIFIKEFPQYLETVKATEWYKSVSA